MSQSSFVDELRQQLEQGIPGETQREKHLRWKVGGGVGALVIALAVSLSVGGGNRTDEQIEAGPVPTPTLASGSSEEPETVPPATARPTPTPGLSIGGQSVIIGELPAPDPGDGQWGATALLPGGQELVADIDYPYVSVWTGEQLVFYGRHRGELLDPEDQSRWPVGTAYRVGANPQWSELPASPGAELRQPVGVWSGEELIVCCGLEGSRRALAWNPSTNQWRSLAPPPLDEGVWVTAAAWAQDRLLIFAGETVLAYQPASDQWETWQSPSGVRSSVSVAAIDHRVVIWPRPSNRTTHNGWLLDTVTGEWTELPAPPGNVWPAIASVAWTGEEIVVMGGLPGAFADASERLVGARLKLDTMEWNALPDIFPEPDGCECNLGSQSLLWTGDRLLVTLGFLGSGINPFSNLMYAYEPATDSWWDLGSVGEGVEWGAALVAMDGQVAFVGSQLVLIDDEALAGGTQVPASGVPAVPNAGYTDLGWRNVPITLVGTDGSGSVVVVDGASGVRTTYLAVGLPWGELSVDGFAMSSDSLYVWNSDREVTRWPSGPGPFGENTNRLVLGELNQPPQEVAAGSGERTVLPSIEGWVWVTQYASETTRQIQLIDAVTGEVFVDAALGDVFRVGTLANGSLVLHAGRGTVGPEGGLVLTTDGILTRFSDDEVLGVTGNVAVTQTCVNGACERQIHDLTDPTIRVYMSPAGDRDYRYYNLGGPMWPTNAAPLSTGSAGGRYLVVRRSPMDRPALDYNRTELALLDVTTGEVTALTSEASVPGVSVATWSRDGRFVVMIANETDVITVDLETGRVGRHPDTIPEGFGILAAG